MRAPRIYSDQSLASNSELELDKKAAHHLTRVLRRKAGDSLVLFNGDGHEYPATLTGVERNGATVTTRERVTRATESPLHTHLGISVSKGDRMDWLVQKATELGVSEITPILSQRCEVRLSGERAQKKQAHWQQVVQSACEQSMRNTVPTVHAITPLGHWLKQTDYDTALVLAPGASNIELGSLAKPARAALLVGPEGGLEDNEIAEAVAQDFSPLALGPRILRTETAPLAAISLMQFLWGDFT